MANTYNTVNSTGNLVYTTNNTAGQFLTSGSNGTSWSQANIPNTHFNSSNNTPIMTIPYGEDKVIVEQKAELEVKGKMILNGLDLEERLKTIEKVLMIPERDATMEAKYPSLKKKFDEYITALEKYKTFERIKGDYE